MSQRYVFFYPNTQSIGLYRESVSGFRRSFTVGVSDLTEPQQATVSGALGWLQSQLEDGETLVFVVFEPLEADEESELHAAITGRRPSGGERTVSIYSNDPEVPSEVRAGLIGLWDELAAIPIPTL